MTHGNTQGAPADERRARERGASSVIGFVIVAPVVILVVFATTYVSLYLLAKGDIEQAARDGARRAALSDSSVAEGIALTESFIADAALVKDGPRVEGSRNDEETSISVQADCIETLDRLMPGRCQIDLTVVVPTETFVEGITP